MALQLIEGYLQDSGMSCSDFGLPMPDIDNSVIPPQNESDVNVSEELEKASKNMELLNDD